VIRNVGGQTAGAQMINATTGAAFAGAVTVYVTIDGGVQAIGSVGGGVCVLEGNGYYSYAPSQAETNGAVCAFTFVGVGAIPQTVQYTTILDLTAASITAAAGLPGALTARNIVTDALIEIGVYDPLQPPSAEDSAFVLRKLNRLIDNMNAERQAVYASVFQAFTLTPALQPHTIGPSGTVAVAQRPVSVDGAMLVLNNVTPNVDVPIRIRDKEWWLGLSVPALTNSMPTDLYYEPAWPNGKLNFWGVPTTAYGVVLLIRALLSQFTLATTFYLPPGYQDAITLTLAEEICTPFRKQPTDRLTLSAMRARARIYANNNETPRIETRDAGMPGGGGETFNYRNRSFG
jgi:hypothetical protein